MANKFNKLLDDTQEFIDKRIDTLSQHPNWKYYKNSFPLKLLFQDCSKFDGNNKNFCKFVKSCSHEMRADYRFKDNLFISIDYNDRKTIIFYTFLLSFCYGFFKGRGLYTGIRNYFLTSLFLCRENFNLKNYRYPF